MQHAQVYYTVAQLAERWQLGELAVRTYIRDGKLKATRLGRGTRSPVRIHVDDIEAFEVRN